MVVIGRHRRIKEEIIGDREIDERRQLKTQKETDKETKGDR